MNTNSPVLVFGEGSSAVFLIQQLLKRNESIVWVEGQGAKLLPVFPQVKTREALSLLMDAAISAGMSFENRVEAGIQHRVFRSKAFKAQSWKKTEEQTWAPELSLIGSEEFTAEGLDPSLVEEALRASFESNPSVTRVQNAPVLEFEVYPSGGKIQFANGLLTEFKQFYYCGDLQGLKSFPKLLPIFTNQMKGIKTTSRTGALQVVFHHSVPLKQFVNRGLLIPMNRESGETFDRDVMGYFIEPKRSVWTVLLQPSECEENHEIMKKLRKLKQSLNRAFESPEFLPEGTKEFMATVEREQVRFEDHALYGEGGLQASDSNPDFVLFSDSFGFSSALDRLSRHFGVKAPEFDTENPVLEHLDGIEMPLHAFSADGTPESQTNAWNGEAGV